MKENKLSQERNDQPEFFTKAVGLAQGAGYDVRWDEGLVCYLNDDHNRCLTNKEIWSDRIFWVSLGKALKWDTAYGCKDDEPHQFKDSDDWNIICSKCGSAKHDKMNWHKQWLRFIDHLADEKDADVFFMQIKQ